MDDKDIKHIADIATAYPILTERVSFPAEQGRSGLTAGAAPLSQKVDLTLREILGWRPRNNDPKGFMASLTQSFELKDVEGQTQWKWRPRTYAAEADLGAITGAQASLYSRARAALDQALPLLDGLTPLRSDHDQEDIDSARAVVRSSLTELVYELGIEGGPRLSRVDGYFCNLLGEIFTRLPDETSDLPSKSLTDPESVSGQLGNLLDVLGLESKYINTVEEEQNLTNFFILVDTVNSLWLTWRTQRTAFGYNPDGKSYLGTQLVLLSRNLSVVAESVEEVYFAMDSVFLGPAERQITPIDNTKTIFFGELLDWVHRFAYEEGPRLLREGGKDGIANAFNPTLDRLINLVQQAVKFSNKPEDAEETEGSGGSKDTKSGLRTARVQRALKELHSNLKLTRGNTDNVARFRKPKVTTISRSKNGHMLVINGQGFQQGGDVQLSLGTKNPIDIDRDDIMFISSSEIKVLLNERTLSWISDGMKAGNPSVNLTVHIINRDRQANTHHFDFKKLKKKR